MSRIKGSRSLYGGRFRSFAGALSALIVLTLLAGMLPAYAASIASASFTSGGIVAGTTRYAKKDQMLQLTVNTSADTQCVDVTGAHTGRQTSSGKSSWNFSFTAGPGDGVKSVNIVVGEDFNSNGCTKRTASTSASYVLDNTGPTLLPSDTNKSGISPIPNAAGWNRSNADIFWSANDANFGAVAATPTSDTITANTAGMTKTATAADPLGNSTTGSVTIKLDKEAPAISGSRSPAANSYGWNNSDVTVGFGCSDGLSGIKSCTGSSTKSVEGISSVTGTALDNADNSASASVDVKIDKTAPTLSGSPISAPNAAGWYKDDVIIDWSAGDALSGIDDATQPGNSTIFGEGTGLTAGASVKDRAGNQTSANSTPVKIDRTAPNTMTSAPSGWTNGGVTLNLSAGDNLSGIQSTYYKVDGGTPQSGPTVALDSEGVHVMQFWSVDNAGNVETAKTVEVKIDKTAPAIGHELSPVPNQAGWNKGNVTVTFMCGDAMSGVASCPAPQSVTTEGKDQVVSGTAADNAGNSASDSATVSVDKTAPTISASRDRMPNDHGWYNDGVIVTFLCEDQPSLSGVFFCPGPETVGEGRNQSLTGTATDKAGNEASVLESGIDVDKTAPMLTGTPLVDPNGDGWYRGDVTVRWSCSDALSGIDGACPADGMVAGEGDALSASASVKDLAGNSKNATVGGIKIDRSAPSTSADVRKPLESGWYAGDVEVKLKAFDSLSGVSKTYYKVDDGDAQLYGGPFDHGLKGEHTITFWSVDQAGNVEDKTAPGHSITLKIDGLPPTIKGSRTPAANNFGWNNEAVTVSFACDDAESGIAGCTDATTLSNEGVGQSVEGIALDNAGNMASTKFEAINIDFTPPRVSGAPTTEANGAGWYKHDVTIAWTAQDGLSGIDPATQAGDSVITGEGSNLGAGPISVSDKAGNSASASVSGIKIDRTAPVVGGGPASKPNAAGWYKDPVTVRFDCTDNLSGVASCPSDKVVSDNGADQSVASGPATDVAGNTTPGKAVGGINIDGQVPTTLSDKKCNKVNGWCTGSTATVVLTATDQAGLSGVKEIRYSVDGGAEQVAAGATKSVGVPLDGSGEASVKYYAVDNAGNVETPNTVALEYDNIAPAVTHTVTPKPNAADWNNSDVTVHFDAKDNDSGSGVDESTVTVDVVVEEETAGRVVNGEAQDFAGNLGTDSVTVKLDKTKPTISGVATTEHNASGWYSGSVAIKFACHDSLSGIPAGTCPDDVNLTANGINEVTRSVKDAAGNEVSVTVSGIKIDSDRPSLDVRGVGNGAIYTLGAVPKASCTAGDQHSGLAAPCNVEVRGGLANGVGTFTYKASATDKAGNTAEVGGSYRVVYRWDGYLQPINDTAHQVGTSTSIFKAGSAVPAKFQIKKADGTVVQANNLPLWTTPAKGSPTSAPVDESAYGEVGSNGTAYRWDATVQHYIYNWGTAKNQAGYYWRMGVTLDDGQSYYVNIGLRF